jgi:hypothetical protein
MELLPFISYYPSNDTGIFHKGFGTSYGSSAWILLA